MPLLFPRSPADDIESAAVPAGVRAELSALPGGVWDHLTLGAALARVAELTVAHLPGADGAGTTLLLDGRVVMTAASAAFVSDVDAVQYGLDQGPCLTAAREAVTVCSNALAHDERWPDFVSTAAELGVHSVLALPLLDGERPLGCLNVYSRRPETFGPVTVAAGEDFARYAVVAVRNAQVMAVSRSLAAEIHRSLKDRTVIDAATGILLRRHGLDPPAARHRLTELATSQQQSVVSVSRRVVADAIVGTRRPGAGPAAGLALSPVADPVVGPVADVAGR